MKTASEIVEGAIEILDERGWCQLTTDDLHRRVCLGEALIQAAAMYNTHSYTWTGFVLSLTEKQRGTFAIATTAVLREAYGVGPGSFDCNDPLETLDAIAGWNDHRARTVTHVQETLTNAAKTLRDQGE